MSNTTETNTTETTRFQCRHILSDGHRCGSPALRHEVFCFYHHTTRKPIQKQELEDRAARRARHNTFDLPYPEDRSAIQHAIGEILRRIANDELDPRRAGLLLYGLQIASLNLPRLAPIAAPNHATDPIEEIVHDPIHGILAPEAEFIIPEKELSIVGQMLKEIEDEKRQLEEEEKKLEETTEPAEKDKEEASAILPTLQASAGPKRFRRIGHHHVNHRRAFLITARSGTNPPQSNTLSKKYRGGSPIPSKHLPAGR